MIDVVRDPRFPEWIPWRKPILVTVPGRASGYGCRICIAERGLRGEQVGHLPQTREEFDRHMLTEHELEADWDGIE